MCHPRRGKASELALLAQGEMTPNNNAVCGVLEIEEEARVWGD